MMDCMLILLRLFLSPAGLDLKICSASLYRQAEFQCKISLLLSWFATDPDCIMILSRTHASVTHSMLGELFDYQY